MTCFLFCFINVVCLVVSFLYLCGLHCCTFAAKRSQPATTGPEDDYARHYAAENGSTSANGTKYLSLEVQREREVVNWIFCTQICVKGAHKSW